MFDPTGGRILAFLAINLELVKIARFRDSMKTRVATFEPPKLPIGGSGQVDGVGIAQSKITYELDVSDTTMSMNDGDPIVPFLIKTWRFSPNSIVIIIDPCVC